MTAARGARPPRRDRSTAEGVLLDTGALVALYLRDDPKHAEVARWIAGFKGQLHSVAPVLAETACHIRAPVTHAIP